MTKKQLVFFTVCLSLRLQRGYNGVEWSRPIPGYQEQQSRSSLLISPARKYAESALDRQSLQFITRLTMTADRPTTQQRDVL